MSFLAKLTIDDQEFNVLECSFEVHTETDSHGLTSGYPTIGDITVLIESSNDLDFYAWSFSPDEYKNGKLVFYKRDAMARLKTLEFRNARCVGYKETFNSSDTNPMQTRLVLVADAVTIENSEFINNWAREYS